MTDEIDKRMAEFDRCDETLMGLMICAGVGCAVWAVILWVCWP